MSDNAKVAAANVGSVVADNAKTAAATVTSAVEAGVDALAERGRRARKQAKAEAERRRKQAEKELAARRKEAKKQVKKTSRRAKKKGNAALAEYRQQASDALAQASGRVKPKRSKKKTFGILLLVGGAVAIAVKSAKARMSQPGSDAASRLVELERPVVVFEHRPPSSGSVHAWASSARVSASNCGNTRVPPMTGMKFMSPPHRGTTCWCRCAAMPAPPTAPWFTPRLNPPG